MRFDADTRARAGEIFDASPEVQYGFGPWCPPPKTFARWLLAYLRFFFIAISGLSFDDIVFASTTRGVKAPLGKTSLNENRRLFFKTVNDWMRNPGTLTRNQYRVVGVQPPSKTWAGFFYNSNPSPSGVTTALANICPANKVCGLSNERPPDNCVRTVNKYDAAGNYVGTGPEDVCQFELHIWAYAPGTVTLAQNAAFHQDAINFVGTIENIPPASE